MGRELAVRRPKGCRPLKRTAALLPLVTKVRTQQPLLEIIKAAEVFAAGLSGIAQKYIDVVAVDDISFEGIRGLGALDPDLIVSREGGEVLLTSAGHEVIRLKAPGADDVAGWAKLTADISLATRQASPELKSADMEAVYEAFFDGVLSNLDIFSRYAGAEEARKNRAKRDGFGGIGIRYKIKDGVVVASDVLPKRPAAKAAAAPAIAAEALMPLFFIAVLTFPMPKPASALTPASPPLACAAPSV